MRLTDKTAEIARALKEEIDIPVIGEALEQEALEWLVAQVLAIADKLLPEWAVRAIVTVGQSLEIDLDRFAEDLNKRVNIRFLSEEREAQIIHSVLRVLMAAAADDSKGI